MNNQTLWVTEQFTEIQKSVKHYVWDNIVITWPRQRERWWERGVDNECVLERKGGNQ